MKGEFLNKKRLKKINEKLKEYYNSTFSLEENFFILRGKDLYIISRDLLLLEDFESLKDVSSGLYVGELYEDNFLRLSVEGTQILGEKASKNVLELDDCDWKQWMMKMNIKSEKFKSYKKAFYIIKHKNKSTNKYDYFGVGLIKEDTLYNYIPKNRAVKEFH